LRTADLHLQRIALASWRDFCPAEFFAVRCTLIGDSLMAWSG